MEENLTTEQSLSLDGKQLQAIVGGARGASVVEDLLVSQTQKRTAEYYKNPSNQPDLSPARRDGLVTRNNERAKEVGNRALEKFNKIYDSIWYGRPR